MQTPNDVDYPVPGNDDAIRAIQLYCELVSSAILDGMQAEIAAQGVKVDDAVNAAADEAFVVKCRKRLIILSSVKKAGGGFRAAAGLSYLEHQTRGMIMAEITAALVKSLRETSGAGMLDCKKALVETNGNMEEAIDWLRKKGLASAAKKASRIAAEGLVSVYVEGNAGAVVEVNSETDFVAKNDIFQDYVENAAKAALAVKGDVEGLKAFTCPVTGKDMGTILTDMIAKNR